MTPQIEFDGRTVWVNGPHCLARFCPISYEVADSTDFDTSYTVRRTDYVDAKKDWAEMWGEFKDLVRERFGVEIKEEAKPLYV